MEHSQHVETIATNQIEDQVWKRVDSKRSHTWEIELESEPKRPELRVQFQQANRSFQLINESRCDLCICFGDVVASSFDQPIRDGNLCQELQRIPSTEECGR